MELDFFYDLCWVNHGKNVEDIASGNLNVILKLNSDIALRFGDDHKSAYQAFIHIFYFWIPEQRCQNSDSFSE
jgi:hypothetical protein